MYKRIVSYVTVIALVICGLAFTPSMQKKAFAAADPSDSGWQLQWSDEFTGNSLNTSTWSYEIGTGPNGDGWGNGEVQYYTNRTDNVFVKDGLLNIRAKREDYYGSSYTSGRIITKNKKYFKYGKMEARLRVEGGNQTGVWPAFWMMGNDYDSVGWPACGELDIMEHANNRNYTEGTLHWGTAWNAHSSWGSFSEQNYNYFTDNNTNGITAWHTYGVTWDSNYIKWYMDDVVFLTASIGPGFDSNAYFNKDAFFLLNLALGGTGTGYTGYQTPDSSFQSATMQVDYVRAYTYNGSQPETLYPSGYTEANRGQFYDLGAWQYYLGNDDWGNAKGAYKGGTSQDYMSMYFTKKAIADWGAQIKPNLSLAANTTYNYSFNVETDAGGNNLMVKAENSGNDQVIVNETLTSGTKNYTGTFTTGEQTTGKVVFNLWNIPTGKTFTVKNFTVWKQGETTQAPTTTTTTPKPTTTAAPTTTQSGELVANLDVPVNSWGKFGNYQVYTGTWQGTNSAKAGVDKNDSSHIVVNKTDTNYNNAWLTQVKLELPDLEPNATYTYEWPIKSTNNKGTICSSDGTDGDDNQVALNGGNQTLTGQVEVVDGVKMIVAGMGWVDTSNPIEFFRPTVKNASGQIVYPSQETTTQKTTTTQKQTTTQKTTTTTAKVTTPAPTTKTTTKAPTASTAAPSKATTSSNSKSGNVKPGKPTVKKITKKKSAKKIKVKLKKAKNAKGYLVVVTKKKNSKKFLVKKKTTKLKVTIKSKKLKNKKKLYVKARAYVMKGDEYVYGDWSKPKKVKIKK